MSAAVPAEILESVTKRSRVSSSTSLSTPAQSTSPATASTSTAASPLAPAKGWRRTRGRRLGASQSKWHSVQGFSCTVQRIGRFSGRYRKVHASEVRTECWALVYSTFQELFVCFYGGRDSRLIGGAFHDESSRWRRHV